MIKYSLKCVDNHRFESWFASADAFEKLRSSGMLSCAICGSAKVDKAIMAPSVMPSDTHAVAPKDPQTTSPSDTPATPAPVKPGPLSAPASAAEQALSELKKKIEESSDYVGRDFAREARAIHDGASPNRSIHGEADLREARDLIDEGVPITPLPFTLRRKTN